MGVQRLRDILKSSKGSPTTYGHYTVLKYGPPISQKDLNYQGLKNWSNQGWKFQQFFLPGQSRGIIGKENPQGAFIMDNLETSLATTVYKASDNARGALLGGSSNLEHQ